MNIQYVGTDKFEGFNATVSCIDTPRAFEEFDLNIIDLSYEKYWLETFSDHIIYEEYYERYDIHFYTLFSMINATKDSNILLVLPGNKCGDYSLKDRIFKVQERLNNMYQGVFRISYNGGIAIINGEEYKSDFIIDSHAQMYSVTVQKNEMLEEDFLDEGYDILVKTKGGKSATIKKDNIYLTTLDISDTKKLEIFLKEIDLLENDLPNVPGWMDEVIMFDDEEQAEKIKQANTIIKEQERSISKAESVLGSNMRLKTILYEQSDSLVEVVFEILEEILNKKISDFVDVKKEDICFEIDNQFFIGEIKGVNSNVKRPHLTQLENHFAEFLERNPKIDEKNVHKLLIINHQKNKPLKDRDPIHPDLISMAKKRYPALIIESETLLKLLEKYRAGEMSKDEIIEMFKANGQLKI